MIEELKIWLHKQRDYYLRQVGDHHFEELNNWLSARGESYENVLDFIEKELEPKYKDDMK